MLPTHIKALIIDMDGVIWKADEPIGDLAGIFRRIRERGLGFVFATNNSTKTPAQYAERLRQFGVKVDIRQIITSSQGVAHAIAQKFAAGTKVFMIGEDGIREPLEEKGLHILAVDEAPEAQVVVMGIDREINFQKVSEATLLVRSGIPFYVTNTDRTFPTPRGEIPGSGAWVSVITTATGVQPVVAGKPFSFLMELALEKLGTTNQETLVIGDRLETDIAAGQAVACPCALVLSGVSTRDEAEVWVPKMDMIAEDLESLIS